MAHSLTFKKRDGTSYHVMATKDHLGWVERETKDKWWGCPDEYIRFGPFRRRGAAAKALHLHALFEGNTVEVVRPGWILFTEDPPLLMDDF